MGKNTVNHPEEQKLLEVLRTRLNVLNTSVFLLADKLDHYDDQTGAYLNRINRELEKIRELIIQTPKDGNGKS